MFSDDYEPTDRLDVLDFNSEDCYPALFLGLHCFMSAPNLAVQNAIANFDLANLWSLKASGTKDARRRMFSFIIPEFLDVIKVDAYAFVSLSFSPRYFRHVIRR